MAAGGWLRRRWVPVLMAVVAAVAAIAAGYHLRERRKTDGLLAEAEQALAARESAQARGLLDRYLTDRPADAHARLLAARAARQAKSYRDARDHLRRCRADGGDAEPIAVEEALVDVAQGDETPVPGLRERATRDDDLALVVLEVLIQHDLDTYQLGSALDGFTRYLARRPDDLYALLGRGFVWERFLNFADALEDYRRAVAAHPDSDRARLKLADTLLIAGTPAEALEHYRWLADRWPARPPVRLGLARCLRRLGRPDEAVPLLDGLSAEFPGHGETLWERGEVELDRGRPAAAEPLLREAARQLPFDRRVQYAAARCLDRLGRAAEAEAFDARVKQLDADLGRLRVVRAEVMRRPDDAALRCEGGLLFLRNGEREEGLRWLRLALRLDPGCAAAREALAAAEAVPGGNAGGDEPALPERRR
ncbi:MAG: tetratricopeptide repeat protein [Gemmataceae bacterium]|nr:tetratricopeptide repeat protein [Gemmataceae bacterium]